MPLHALSGAQRSPLPPLDPALLPAPAPLPFALPAPLPFALPAPPAPVPLDAAPPAPPLPPPLMSTTGLSPHAAKERLPITTAMGLSQMFFMSSPRKKESFDEAPWPSNRRASPYSACFEVSPIMRREPV